MCGIFGHISPKGKKESVVACLDGLRRLEYRGYDSAGIAGIESGELLSCKTVGKVEILDKTVRSNELELELAIGHTRWATHGKLTKANAHPHTDQMRSIALVHNGIIENYAELKKALKKQGVTFTSETDSEVITQLIASHYRGDLLFALQQTLIQIRGSFAIALIHKEHPNLIVAAARGCPLVIGICEESKAIFLSSDTNAFTNKELNVCFLQNDEVALIRSDSFQVFDEKGNETKKPKKHLSIELETITKEGYEHFMLKEIHDQPTTIAKALEHRYDLDKSTLSFEELTISDELLKKTTRIIILGCGTSYHAGLLASSYFEEFSRTPTSAEIASEFRYTNPIIDDTTLIIAISQSGETADTLSAVREAKSRGAKVVSLCNMKLSTLTRESDSTLFLRAGPEVSVCSTKAFTSQLTLLLMLSLHMANLKQLHKQKVASLLSELKGLPFQVELVLRQKEKIKQIAKKYAKFPHFFFLGRRYMYPTSLEAALKLKEISYLNASGYSSGEMKHGPIALIDKNLPTVALCANAQTFDKLHGNLMEIKSRGGPILAFAPKSTKGLSSITKDILYLPEISDELAPISYSVATQLLAYYIALELGTDIDRPRNLAKSVTVE